MRQTAPLFVSASATPDNCPGGFADTAMLGDLCVPAGNDDIGCCAL